MIVQVLTDVGKKKPIVLCAKVVETNDSVYKIKYLSPTSDLFNGKRLYRYETETYEIDEESITEKLNDEIFGGFKKVDDGFIKTDSDTDYIPSDDESVGSNSTSESLTESENSDDENEEDYYDYENDSD